MPKYELSDATRDFTQHSIAINNLWTVYTVVTFAAAGYGISKAVDWPVAVVIAVGFWVFVGGHLLLLYLSIKAQEALAVDILAAASDTEFPFRRSVEAIVSRRNRMQYSLSFHLANDVIATAALLLRASWSVSFWVWWAALAH